MASKLQCPPSRFQCPPSRFAHIAEARSRALGAQPGIGGPFAEEVDLNSTVFAFGDGYYTSHSAQFQSTYMHRYMYWRQLLISVGIGNA